MGLKDRKKMEISHRLKRKKKRDKLRKKGLDPDKFYYGAFFIGLKEGGNE